MTYLIRVNSSGEVLDGEGRPTGNVVVPMVAKVMLSVDCPDIDALAVKVPKRREPPFMGWDSDREEYSAEGHNACLDALGIAP